MSSLNSKSIVGSNNNNQENYASFQKQVKASWFPAGNAKPISSVRFNRYLPVLPPNRCGLPLFWAVQFSYIYNTSLPNCIATAHRHMTQYFISSFSAGGQSPLSPPPPALCTHLPKPLHPLSLFLSLLTHSQIAPWYIPVYQHMICWYRSKYQHI